VRNHPRFKGNLGQYIHQDVKHSLSHIVRNNKGKSVELDNLAEINHLNAVCSILEEIACYRMQRDFKMDEPHNLDVFRYCNLSDAC
jgi:hypothetical protein